MNAGIRAFAELLETDRRFKFEAYQFIRESLSYAHDVLQLGNDPAFANSDLEDGRHLTGQQLCEACRRYALEQYGFMARLVLNAWGIHSTSDFGEIVYNLIRIEQMRKSDSDRREDFDNVFRFEDAFQPEFESLTSGSV
ncbi:MAG: hypothetical protein R3C05_06575 [Pirellulaceae bacterium]